MIDGFFDVESRGAFQGYQALKARRRAPARGRRPRRRAGRTPTAAHGDTKAWFDHYLRGVDNGVEERAAREAAGCPTATARTCSPASSSAVDGADWPIPGTRWQSLALDPARERLGNSLNDGSLRAGTPRRRRTQSYPSVPSLSRRSRTRRTPRSSAASASNALTNALPILTRHDAGRAARAVVHDRRRSRATSSSAGPASLELRLSSTAPATTSGPSSPTSRPTAPRIRVASARLNSAYPASTQASR